MVLPVSIDIGSHEFCLPTSTIDTQVACDSYTWIDSITYTSSNSTATQLFTNVGGCDSLVTLDLTINRVDTSVVRTDSSLYVSSTGTYQWLDCLVAMQVLSGQTGQTFVPTRNGSYAVEIAQNSCVDTSSCFSFLKLAILGSDFEKAIVVYPNPTNGTGLSINLSEFGNYQKVSISIISILGETLYSQVVSGGREVVQINTNGLFSSGQYVVIIKSEASTIYQKLIVK
jgi:hypothetical protein